MKRPYEITVVFRILATEDETKEAIDQVVEWIEKADDNGNAQGKVTKLDRTRFGRRKLAYEIDKQRDGLYIIFYADVEPAHLTDFELNLKVYNPVLRHLVVRLEEEKPKAEAEATEVPSATE